MYHKLCFKQDTCGFSPQVSVVIDINRYLSVWEICITRHDDFWLKCETFELQISQLNTC